MNKDGFTSSCCTYILDRAHVEPSTSVGALESHTFLWLHIVPGTPFLTSNGNPMESRVIATIWGIINRSVLLIEENSSSINQNRAKMEKIPKSPMNPNPRTRTESRGTYPERRRARAGAIVPARHRGDGGLRGGTADAATVDCGAGRRRQAEERWRQAAERRGGGTRPSEQCSHRTGRFGAVQTA